MALPEHETSCFICGDLAPPEAGICAVVIVPLFLPEEAEHDFTLYAHAGCLPRAAHESMREDIALRVDL